MKMLKRTIFIILILIILLLGAGNYANAQGGDYTVKYRSTVKNLIDVRSKGPPVVRTHRNKLARINIRAPPLSYCMKGDTIYIAAAYFDSPDNYVYEFVAKPEDKMLIKMLLEGEINDKDEKAMYFLASENWDGRFVKTSRIQIGQEAPYVFEAANKKEP